MDSTQFALRPGAAPFLLDGGEVGVVCTHGFTASPEEMRWLGNYLHARGLTVYAPRLAGHGTDPELMRRQHWLDWYESVLDGVALLRARCRTVFAVGMSMGGLLSLRAAAMGLVDGVAALAAPFTVRQRLIRFAPIIKYARPMIAKKPGDLEDRVRAVQRAMGCPEYGRGDYKVIPTASAAQLHALMAETRRCLPEIRVPVLLVYSRADQTVPYHNLELARARLTHAAEVVTHTLERSDHCLTQEIERETVYRVVWEFVAGRSQMPA